MAKLKFVNKKQRTKRNPFIVKKSAKKYKAARCKKTRLSVEAVDKIFKGIQKSGISDGKLSRTQSVVRETTQSVAEKSVSGCGIRPRDDVQTSVDDLLKQTLLTNLSLASN